MRHLVTHIRSGNILATYIPLSPSGPGWTSNPLWISIDGPALGPLFRPDGVKHPPPTGLVTYEVARQNRVDTIRQ